VESATAYEIFDMWACSKDMEKATIVVTGDDILKTATYKKFKQ